MRTTNLKFIYVTLCAVIFLVAGFFISITKVSAAEATQSFPYSLSAVSSYPNDVGGTTTIVRVGCVPGFGDKYDINTGRLCPYSLPGARMGCAKNSGDKYDVNTGKLCVYLNSNIMIGCGANSTDKYDINTGKLCVKNSVTTNSNSVTKNTGGSGKTAMDINPIFTEGGITKDSVTDKDIGNSLTASGGRINSIFTWPMSTRAISIIIILILGLGYGIYSFTKKEETEELIYAEPKNKHKEEVKPIVTAQAPKANPQPTPINTNTPPVKTPEQPVNPQSKIPNTPLTHTQPVNPNPQMPLNISNNQAPQGPSIQK